MASQEEAKFLTLLPTAIGFGTHTFLTTGCAVAGDAHPFAAGSVVCDYRAGGECTRGGCKVAKMSGGGGSYGFLLIREEKNGLCTKNSEISAVRESLAPVPIHANQSVCARPFTLSSPKEAKVRNPAAVTNRGHAPSLSNAAECRGETCPRSSYYSATADAKSTTELHVVSVYQPPQGRMDPSGKFIGFGVIDVDVHPTKLPVDLHLAAYAKSTWRVRALPGAKIRRIIFSSYDEGSKVETVEKNVEIVAANYRSYLYGWSMSMFSLTIAKADGPHIYSISGTVAYAHHADQATDARASMGTLKYSSMVVNLINLSYNHGTIASGGRLHINIKKANASVELSQLMDALSKYHATHQFNFYLTCANEIPRVELTNVYDATKSKIMGYWLTENNGCKWHIDRRISGNSELSKYYPQPWIP